jgi:hypothetical protein
MAYKDSEDAGYDKEAFPVKLIYSDPGLTPYPCTRFFIGLTTARSAQKRLGGTLRAFIDGKWQDVKE